MGTNKRMVIYYNYEDYEIEATVYKDNSVEVECESEEFRDIVYDLLNEELDLKITDYTMKELEEMIHDYIHFR